MGGSAGNVQLLVGGPTNLDSACIPLEHGSLFFLFRDFVMTEVDCGSHDGACKGGLSVSLPVLFSSCSHATQHLHNFNFCIPEHRSLGTRVVTLNAVTSGYFMFKQRIVCPGL